MKKYAFLVSFGVLLTSAFAVADVSKEIYVSNSLPKVAEATCANAEMKVAECYSLSQAICTRELSLQEQSCARDMDRVLPVIFSSEKDAGCVGRIINACAMRRFAASKKSALKTTPLCQGANAEYLKH